MSEKKEVKTIERWSTISPNHGADKINLRVESLRIIAPYVVDDSKFEPKTSALRQLSGHQLTDSQLKSLYDFPDGKDDGRELPLGRKRGVQLPELSQEVLRSGSELSKTKQSIDRQLNFEARLNQKNAAATAKDNTFTDSSSKE